MQRENAERLSPRTKVPASESYVARDVSVWALASGRTLSPRALDVIVGAKLARQEPFGQWTEQAVNELLWAGILTWCRAHDVECPPAVAETLWSYLSYLQEHRGFVPPSDPLARLRAPLIAVGGLTRDGRLRVIGRRHPSEQVRPARPSARLAPVVPLLRAARG